LPHTLPPTTNHHLPSTIRFHFLSSTAGGNVPRNWNLLAKAGNGPEDEWVVLKIHRGDR